MTISNKALLSTDGMNVIKARAAAYLTTNVPALGPGKTYFSQGGVIQQAGDVIVQLEIANGGQDLDNAKARQYAKKQASQPYTAVYDITDGSRWDLNGSNVWVQTTGNQLANVYPYGCLLWNPDSDGLYFFRSASDGGSLIMVQPTVGGQG